MITKVVLEIHALCNKNEISYVSQKCNVINHGFALMIAYLRILEQRYKQTTDVK